MAGLRGFAGRCVARLTVIAKMAAEARKVSRVSRNNFRETRKGKEMTTADDVVAEMRVILRDTLPVRDGGMTLQRALETAAYRLGISYSRAVSYWHYKVRQVPAHEADEVRRRARAARRQKIRELEAEIARLQAMDSAPADRMASGKG